MTRSQSNSCTSRHAEEPVTALPPAPCGRGEVGSIPARSQARPTLTSEVRLQTQPSASEPQSTHLKTGLRVLTPGLAVSYQGSVSERSLPAFPGGPGTVTMAPHEPGGPQER